MKWSVSSFNLGSNGNIDIWLGLKILLCILENLPDILDINDFTLHGGSDTNLTYRMVFFTGQPLKMT